MIDSAVIGTSYPPGHNYWPGSPMSWWLRGTLAFLVVAGPQLLASLLAVRFCRRRRDPELCVAACAVLLGVWLAWPFLLGINVRDGDRPLFYGLVWGFTVRHWLFGLGVVACIVATLVRPRDPRGFPVIPPTR